MDEAPDIQQRQREQYAFPYHHIPFIDERGEGRRIRILKWGFEYLAYMEHLAQEVTSLRPSSVLDVGCGDGYFLGRIGKQVPLRVGVDIDDRALSFARAFVPGVDYRSCNVADVSETFDVVSAIEVLEHIPDESVSGFLQAVASRVKAGGVLIISVPTTNVPLNSKHFRHYDLPLLESHIEKSSLGMSLVRSQFYYKDTLLERLYQRATRSVFVQGEIPLLRGFVWRHVKQSAPTATSSNGLHLIAVLRKTGA